MNNDSRPSAKHPPLESLGLWLEIKDFIRSEQPSYTHLLIKQKDEVAQKAWDELFEYIDHAHEGARQSLRAPLEDSLHPIHYGTQKDPAFGYPHKLCDSALQGFFGEIIAGIIAEKFINDGKFTWENPVYLFRTHIIAFQQLELMRQSGDWNKQIIGRTGDDALAFSRDANGDIVAWLACESKCTRNHSSSLIADNHKKLSQAAARPVDMLRAIDALKDYRDDEYSKAWIKALQRYYWDSDNKSERCDLCVYVCGSIPKTNSTWIPTDAPHECYTGKRDLICSEIHMPNVLDIILSLYKKMDGTT